MNLKSFFTSFSLFLFFLLNQAFSKEPETIHIVFDIDWTLVSPLKGNSFIPPTEKQNEQYVTVLGESYHITDGVSELLTELKQYPHLKISFFSGGSKERNELLLKNIKLKHSELTAYDIATKILSFQDLKDLYPNEKNKIVRFSERYRKPLARYFSPLDRTLLIDDDASFIEESEISNLYSLGKTYHFYDKFEDAVNALQKKPNDPYIPNRYNDWYIERNKIILLEDYLMESIRLDLSSPEKKPFLKNIQRFHQMDTEKQILKRLKHNKILKTLACIKEMSRKPLFSNS